MRNLLFASQQTYQVRTKRLSYGRLLLWENQKEEETGVAALPWSFPSPGINHTPPPRACLGGANQGCVLERQELKGAQKLHTERGTSYTYPLSVCTGTPLQLGNESLQPYLFKTHFWANVLAINYDCLLTFTNQNKNGVNMGEAWKKKKPETSKLLQEVAFKGQ